MDLNNLIQIVELVAAVAFGLMSYISKRNANVAQMKQTIVDGVATQIQIAENQYKDVAKAGGMKFEYVVDKLMGFVPVSMQKYITREFIADTVQTIFDDMERYAETQVENFVDKKLGKFLPDSKEKK